MKALTILQPWAHLIATDQKEIETRSWKTNYRGALAIHAGARGWDARPGMLNYVTPVDDKQMVFGAVIAIVNLEGCILIRGYESEFRIDGTHRIWKLNDLELTYGDFTPGRYAWLLRYVQKLDNPIPVKGRLGLWNFNDRFI